MTYEPSLADIGRHADSEVAGLRSQLAEASLQLTSALDAAEASALEVAGLNVHITDLEARIAELEAQLPTPLDEHTCHHGDRLADTFGVNTHFAWNSSVYGGNVTQAVDLVNRLGARHVRERLALKMAGQRQAFTALADLGVGAHVTIGVFNQPTDFAAHAAYVKANLALFTSVGGVNEPNNSPKPANWAAITVAHQKGIWDSLNGVLPVVGPALKDREATLANDFAELKTLGISRYLDFGDFHRYPMGDVPTNGLAERQAMASATVAGKPLYATEGGYNTSVGATTGGNAVTEAEQAIYAPRHLLEMFSAGIERFFIYELIDQDTGGAWPGNWGLVKAPSNDPATWKIKLAFSALATLIAQVADPGPAYTPPSVRATVDGPADLKTLCFGKRDGSAVMVLWRDLVASDTTSLTVTITLPDRVEHVDVGSTVQYLPIR